jgi:hypothetical protein
VLCVERTPEVATKQIAKRASPGLDNLLLPYTFDISIDRHINNPDLIGHIQRAGVSFYQK